MGHTTTTHDVFHLLLPVILKQLIGLIDDGEANTTEGETVATTHDVTKATRSSDEKIATLGELVQLITHGSTTVSDARAKHGAIAETTSLVEDLTAQFTGGGNDKNQRLSSNTVNAIVEVLRNVGTSSSQLLGLAHELGDSRNQISSGLARA